MRDLKDMYTDNYMSLKEIKDLNKKNIPGSRSKKSNTKYH